VRSLCVVVPSPVLDGHLCLDKTVEQLTVKQLIAKLGVAAFAIGFVGTALHWSVLLPSRVLSGFPQDRRLKREIRDGLPEPLVLSSEVFQTLDLIRLEPAELLVPAIIK
jgi:hypothetical protein